VSLRTTALLCAVSGALLLGACTTTTPQANFYLLNATEPAPVVRASSLVLAIGPVDLPQYLDRPHIVTRNGSNRLRVDEFNRWGGALEEGIIRVVARRVGARLGTQRIYSYPSRVVADTDFRIALDIRAFDGYLDGDVVLDVSWSLIDDRSGEVVQTQQARYQRRSPGADYDAYAAALSDTLAQLGDDLATVLAGLAPSVSRR